MAHLKVPLIFSVFVNTPPPPPPETTFCNIDLVIYRFSHQNQQHRRRHRHHHLAIFFLFFIFFFSVPFFCSYSVYMCIQPLPPSASLNFIEFFLGLLMPTETLTPTLVSLSVSLSLSISLSLYLYLSLCDLLCLTVSSIEMGLTLIFTSCDDTKNFSVSGETRLVPTGAVDISLLEGKSLIYVMFCRRREESYLCYVLSWEGRVLFMIGSLLGGKSLIYDRLPLEREESYLCYVLSWEEKVLFMIGSLLGWKSLGKRLIYVMFCLGRQESYL